MAGSQPSRRSMLTVTANILPSHQVEYRERRKVRRDRLLKFDGTILLVEDSSEVTKTAVNDYNLVKGELMFNVGTCMSLNDLAVKAGLSVQRLIDLNAEVFGEEQLNTDTILKPGNTIWFKSEPESSEEADGSSAHGTAGAHTPPDRQGSLKGARRKQRAAADLSTALKAKSRRVQLMNLFQADNMSLNTRLKWMGE